MLDLFDDDNLFVNNDSILVHNTYLFKISSIIIPFSSIIKKKIPTDIYSGEEDIPFIKKDPKFRKILLQEFL